jgi:hypothetical protein
MNASRARTPATALSILALALTLSGGSAGFAAETVTPGPLPSVKSSVSRAGGIVRSSPAGSEQRRTGIARVSHELFDFEEIARRERMRSNRLPRGAPTTQRPPVPDPLAVGVFLATLRTHARSR